MAHLSGLDASLLPSQPPRKPMQQETSKYVFFYLMPCGWVNMFPFFFTGIWWYRQAIHTIYGAQWEMPV
jgi:hypothetical protein